MDTMNNFITEPGMTINKHAYEHKPVWSSPKIFNTAEWDYYKLSEYTIDDIAELIGKGHTITPAIFNYTGRSDKTRVAQASIIGLDYDKDGEVDGVLSIFQKINLTPNIYYETYNSRVVDTEHNGIIRFRLIWILTYPIDADKFTRIIKALMIYSTMNGHQTDDSCTNINRYFAGTNASIGREVKVLNNNLTNPALFNNIAVLTKINNKSYSKNKSKHDREAEIIDNTKSTIEVSIDDFIAGMNILRKYSKLLDIFMNGETLEYLAEAIFYGNFNNIKIKKGTYNGKRIQNIEQLFIRPYLELAAEKKSYTHSVDDKIDRYYNFGNNKAWVAYPIINNGPYTGLTYYDFFKKTLYDGSPILNIRERISLEAAQIKLKELFIEAVKSTSLLEIITTPTGTGKTEEIINTVKVDDGNTYIVAEPDGNMINELNERLIKAGAIVNKISTTKPTDLAAKGIYDKRSTTTYERDLDREYAIANLFVNKARLTICSHEFLLTHYREISQLATETKLIVFIDETPADSIIKLSIFNKAQMEHQEKLHSIPISLFTKIHKATENKETSITISKDDINNLFSPDYYDYEEAEHSDYNFPGIALENLLKDNKEHTAYILYENDDYEIIFPETRRLDFKSIILSATPKNEKLKDIVEALGYTYKEPMEVGAVQNKGKIIQVLSTSNDFTGAKSQGYDKLKDTAEEVLRYFNFTKDDILILTFMKYEKELRADGFKIPEKDGKSAHYGAQQGLDYMKGQNILVLGKYIKSPKYYKEYALTTAYPRYRKLYGDEALNIINNIGKRIKTKVYLPGNYPITYYALEEEIAAELELEDIKAELAQAAGRARAVREDATVLIVANIPIPEADEYIELKKYENKP